MASAWLERTDQAWQQALAQAPEMSTCEAKYDFVQKLGKGSYGVLYQAHNKNRHHTVAIKMLSPQRPAGPEIAKAACEMQIMQTASGHPNVVSFEEAFYSPGQVAPPSSPTQVALVMELRRGSLHDYLVHFRSILEEQRAAWSKDLCTGLGHLRLCHIMHRDLKPGNLLLLPSPQQDILKITDFGNSCIAVQDTGSRPLMADLKPLAKACCTFSYAAPEVLRNQAYDFRCDVWSAGVIMYQLLQEDCVTNLLLRNLQQHKLQSHLPAASGVVAAPAPHSQVHRGRLHRNAPWNGTPQFQQSWQIFAASVMAIAATIAQLGITSAPTQL